MTDEIREAFEKLHNFDLETDEDGDYTKLETSTCFNFYMAGHQAAKADREKEIAELQAHINNLVEGLQKARSMVGHPDNLDVIYEYLHRTPAQSLKAHDDALIDKCVKAILDVGGQRVWEFADAIKFLGK